MKAVQFEISVPKYGLTKVAGMISPKAFYGKMSCLSLTDIPEPELRGPRWVKLRSVLSGICGSDMGVITEHDSPTGEPFISDRFVFGHENYSIVEELGSEVKGLEKGDRVTINPSLCCVVREIDPLCGPCSRGDTSICENFAEGNLAPGMDLGYCEDTGGGWSKYYIAHETQIVKVPDSFTDEQAMMIEPLCSSLHPVMKALPRDGDQVLVIGCGVIGLGVIASIKALGIDCHVTGVEPVPLNAEKAREKGADEIIDPSSESLYDRTVEITRARIYKPVIGKQIGMGGYDRIFDCVGSGKTINDSFRLAAGDSIYSLIGIQLPLIVDWAPVWLKGLTIMGNLGYGMDEYEGKRMHTFDVAMDLIKNGLDTSDLITHRFSINDYVKAIEVNMAKAKHGAIKTIFDLSDQ